MGSIATMERKIAEMKNKVDEVQSELADLDDNEAETDGSDRKWQQYKQLVEQDNKMNDFLEKFDEVRTEHKTRLEEAETNVVDLLQKISAGMERTENMPTLQEHMDDKSQLDYKTKEYGRSENTAKALQHKMQNLQKHQQNVHKLESKISAEMEERKRRALQDKSGW